ncbi:MAG TPA: molybdenum cofactor biosynthesis protein MoeB [Ignavibacteria bacterium]|nr:molybdenum cofactor biosynthesis protein MoeB [Ignavibacteria bacterium]
MNNDELNFYKRQINLPNFGLEGQEKLKNSKALVVGAGGLGSPAILYLSAAGVGKIGVCDFDKVEITNLHRQIIFDYEEVGKTKTQSAKKKINKFNPLINIEEISESVSPDNVENIISGYDVVLDCTDNFATKFLLHDACYLNKINLVQSSIYQFEGQLQVFRFAEDTGQGCYRCLWQNIPEEGCVGTCADAGVLGVVPGIFGTLQALETIKILLNWDGLVWNESLIFDLLSLNSRKIRWKKNVNCPLCGGNKIIKQINPGAYNRMKDFEISYKDVDLTKYKIVDIRESFERVEEFLKDDSLKIEHIPYSTLQNSLPNINNGDTYLFYCRSGRRTKELVGRLWKNNYKNTFSLKEGAEGISMILDSNKK